MKWYKMIWNEISVKLRNFPRKIDFLRFLNLICWLFTFRIEFIFINYELFIDILIWSFAAWPCLAGDRFAYQFSRGSPKSIFKISINLYYLHAAEEGRIKKLEKRVDENVEFKCFKDNSFTNMNLSLHWLFDGVILPDLRGIHVIFS